MEIEDFEKLKEGDRVVLKHNDSLATVVKTGIIDRLRKESMVKLKCDIKTWSCPYFFRHEIKEVHYKPKG